MVEAKALHHTAHPAGEQACMRVQHTLQVPVLKIAPHAGEQACTQNSIPCR